MASALASDIRRASSSYRILVSGGFRDQVYARATLTGRMRIPRLFTPRNFADAGVIIKASRRFKRPHSGDEPQMRSRRRAWIFCPPRAPEVAEPRLSNNGA